MLSLKWFWSHHIHNHTSRTPLLLLPQSSLVTSGQCLFFFTQLLDDSCWVTHVLLLDYLLTSADIKCHTEPHHFTLIEYLTLQMEPHTVDNDDDAYGLILQTAADRGCDGWSCGWSQAHPEAHQSCWLFHPESDCLSLIFPTSILTGNFLECSRWQVGAWGKKNLMYKNIMQ